VATAATKFGHTFGILAMFRAVLAKGTVRRDRAGTTRVSALLRLIHRCLLLAKLRALSHGRDGAARQKPTLRPFFGDGARSRLALALRPENAAPLLVLGNRHPALDTDPHPLPGLVPRKELFQNGHDS
jgi:hypothetical protein